MIFDGRPVGASEFLADLLHRDDAVRISNGGRTDVERPVAHHQIFPQHFTAGARHGNLVAPEAHLTHVDPHHAAGVVDGGANNTAERLDLEFGVLLDQSLVEENAAAIGVTYEDNEELEIIEKIEKRDRDRYELDESSKASEDMI